MAIEDLLETLRKLSAADVKSQARGSRIARRSAQPEQRQHCENDHDKADEINDAVHFGLSLRRIE
jgi:hypothetical protein